MAAATPCAHIEKTMHRNQWKPLCLFLGPALVLYVLLVAWPNVAALYVSLLRWDGYTGESAWVGFANFSRLLLTRSGHEAGSTDSLLVAFAGLAVGLAAALVLVHLRLRGRAQGAARAVRILPGVLVGLIAATAVGVLVRLAATGRGDPVLWVALGNNVFLTIVPGVLTLALALVVAHLTSRPGPLSGLVQATCFFPNLLSGLVVGVLWSFLYNPRFGLINAAFRLVGLSDLGATPWLAADTFIAALVPLLVWSMTGFYVVLLSAAMKNVPTDLYEAARIDGASEMHAFFRITLPLLHETLLVAVVFLVISGMRIFELIWVLSYQYVNPDHEVMATFMYQKALVEGDFGYGSAVSVVLFLLILGATLALRGVLRRDVVEY